MNNFLTISRNGGQYAPSYPLLSGTLGDVCTELIGSGLNPAIVISQCIAFASFLTQAISDIKWPNNHTSPIGLSWFLRASSSSGKSVVFDLLMDAISEAIEAWYCANPEAEIKPAFFAEDATREALIEQILEWKSCGLFTDEGGMMRLLIKNAPSTLAKLIDGSTINNARVGKGRAVVSGHRLTILMTEQPGIDGVGAQLFQGANSGVGIVNRMGIAEVTTDYGGLTARGFELSPGTQQAIEILVNALVERSIAMVLSKDIKPALRMTREAQQFFIQATDDVRQQLHNHPENDKLRSYVSRHAERVLRLVGTLHVVAYGTEGEVPLHLVQEAQAIDSWNISNFERMSYVPPKKSQAEVDAELIWDCATPHLTRFHTTFCYEDFQLMAKNLGLTSSRVDKAVAVLTGLRRVTLAKEDRKKVLTVHLYGAPFTF